MLIIVARSLTPTHDAAKKPVPTPLSKYLDGITNVAVALQNGGILIGDNTGNGDAENLAVTINGVNDTALDDSVGQGNITGQISSIVTKPLIGKGTLVLSAPPTTRVSGSPGTPRPDPNNNHQHDGDCDCASNTSDSHTATSSTQGSLSMSASSGDSPSSSLCGLQTTITETWHSTHFKQTATYFSFMSVFTITETAR